MSYAIDDLFAHGWRFDRIITKEELYLTVDILRLFDNVCIDDGSITRYQNFDSIRITTFPYYGILPIYPARNVKFTDISGGIDNTYKFEEVIGILDRYITDQKDNN